MSKTQKIGSVTSDSVKKYTKKDWDQWIQILNKRSAQSFSHQNLVLLLRNEFKLTPWWQQEVARGYQIAIGIRIPQQTLKGTYTTTVTKSFTSTAKNIYLFLISEQGQNFWLKPMYPISFKAKQSFECEGEIFGEFRTITPNKKIRMTWVDSEWPHKSIVQINLYLKPKKKCMLVINHLDLPTLKAKKQMHEYWRKIVDEMAAKLGLSFANPIL